MSITRLSGLRHGLPLVVICLGLVYAMGLSGGSPTSISISATAQTQTQTQAEAKRTGAVKVEHDPDKLPSQVVEMRDAILAAALSGNIDELLVPIQWNELTPDFGAIDAAKPIEGWKKLSIDGQGREILAVLLDILAAPYAVTRRGADIENNKLYVWPYFAEVPLDKLAAAEHTQLLRLIPRDNYKAMIKSGKYGYWRLVIGADGTWHAFAKVAQ